MDWTVLAGVVLAIGCLWIALVALLWAVRPRDVRARELVRVVPDLVRLLRAMIADRTLPIDVRVVLLALVAWIVSPIDLVPEFVPVIGPLDDVVVAMLAIRYVRRRVGLDGIRRRWPGSDEGFALVARLMGG